MLHDTTPLPPPPQFRSPAERGAASILEDRYQHERAIGGGGSSPTKKKHHHHHKSSSGSSSRHRHHHHHDHTITTAGRASPSPLPYSPPRSGDENTERDGSSSVVVDGGSRQRSTSSFRLPTRQPVSSSISPSMATVPTTPPPPHSTRTPNIIQYQQQQSIQFSPSLYKKLLAAEFNPSNRHQAEMSRHTATSQGNGDRVVDFHTADYMNQGASGQSILEARYQHHPNNSSINITTGNESITDGVDLAPPPPRLQGGRGFRLGDISTTTMVTSSSATTTAPQVKGSSQALKAASSGMSKSGNGGGGSFRLPSRSPSRDTHTKNREVEGREKKVHKPRFQGVRSPLSSLTAISPIARRNEGDTTVASTSHIQSNTPTPKRKQQQHQRKPSPPPARSKDNRVAPPDNKQPSPRSNGVDVSLSPMSVGGTPARMVSRENTPTSVRRNDDASPPPVVVQWRQRSQSQSSQPPDHTNNNNRHNRHMSSFPPDLDPPIYKSSGQCGPSVLMHFIDTCERYGVPEDITASHVKVIVNSMQKAVDGYGEVHREDSERRLEEYEQSLMERGLISIAKAAAEAVVATEEELVAEASIIHNQHQKDSSNTNTNKKPRAMRRVSVTPPRPAPTNAPPRNALKQHNPPIPVQLTKSAIIRQEANIQRRERIEVERKIRRGEFVPSRSRPSFSTNNSRATSPNRTTTNNTTVIIKSPPTAAFMHTMASAAKVVAHNHEPIRQTTHNRKGNRFKPIGESVGSNIECDSTPSDEDGDCGDSPRKLCHHHAHSLNPTETERLWKEGLRGPDDTSTTTTRWNNNTSKKEAAALTTTPKASSSAAGVLSPSSDTRLDQLTKALLREMAERVAASKLNTSSSTQASTAKRGGTTPSRQPVSSGGGRQLFPTSTAGQRRIEEILTLMGALGNNNSNTNTTTTTGDGGDSPANTSSSFIPLHLNAIGSNKSKSPSSKGARKGPYTTTSSSMSFDAIGKLPKGYIKHQLGLTSMSHHHSNPTSSSDRRVTKSRPTTPPTKPLRIHNQNNSNINTPALMAKEDAADKDDDDGDRLGDTTIILSPKKHQQELDHENEDESTDSLPYVNSSFAIPQRRPSSSNNNNDNNNDVVTTRRVSTTVEEDNYEVSLNLADFHRKNNQQQQSDNGLVPDQRCVSFISAAQESLAMNRSYLSQDIPTTPKGTTNRRPSSSSTTMNTYPAPPPITTTYPHTGYDDSAAGVVVATSAVATTDDGTVRSVGVTKKDVQVMSTPFIENDVVDMPPPPVILAPHSSKGPIAATTPSVVDVTEEVYIARSQTSEEPSLENTAPHHSTNTSTLTSHPQQQQQYPQQQRGLKPLITGSKNRSGILSDEQHQRSVSATNSVRIGDSGSRGSSPDMPPSEYSTAIPPNSTSTSQDPDHHHHHNYRSDSNPSRSPDYMSHPPLSSVVQQQSQYGVDHTTSPTTTPIAPGDPSSSDPHHPTITMHLPVTTRRSSVSMGQVSSSTEGGGASPFRSYTDFPHHNDDSVDNQPSSVQNQPAPPQPPEWFRTLAPPKAATHHHHVQHDQHYYNYGYDERHPSSSPSHHSSPSSPHTRWGVRGTSIVDGTIPSPSHSPPRFALRRSPMATTTTNRNKQAATMNDGGDDDDDDTYVSPLRHDEGRTIDMDFGMTPPPPQRPPPTNTNRPPLLRHPGHYDPIVSPAESVGGGGTYSPSPTTSPLAATQTFQPNFANPKQQQQYHHPISDNTTTSYYRGQGINNTSYNSSSVDRLYVTSPPDDMSVTSSMPAESRKWRFAAPSSIEDRSLLKEASAASKNNNNGSSAYGGVVNTSASTSGYHPQSLHATSASSSRFKTRGQKDAMLGELGTLIYTPTTTRFAVPTSVAQRDVRSYSN